MGSGIEILLRTGGQDKGNNGFRLKTMQTRKSSYAFDISFLEQISKPSPKPPVEIRDNQEEREKTEEEEQKNFNYRILVHRENINRMSLYV